MDTAERRPRNTRARAGLVDLVGERVEARRRVDDAADRGRQLRDIRREPRHRRRTASSTSRTSPRTSSAVDLERARPLAATIRLAGPRSERRHRRRRRCLRRDCHLRVRARREDRQGALAEHDARPEGAPEGRRRARERVRHRHPAAGRERHASTSPRPRCSAAASSTPSTRRPARRSGRSRR